MADSREELERRLARDPFDVEARQLYGQSLFDEEDYAASLEQWRLLLKQEPSHLEAMIGAALCCHRRGDSDEARRFVESARQLPGFSPDDPRLGELRPEEPARLRIVAGGRPEESEGGEVLSISTTERVRFCDVVGMEHLKKVIRLRIIDPFLKPALFRRFKKKIGGGVLLYGPPGCGKTMMARAIAHECDAAFTPVGISDILEMWVGSSERNLAAIFEKARSEAPAVLFFDELDALAYSRSKASTDHTRTLVNEFLAQLDGLAGHNRKILILAATNMPWDVDDAMKRPGRFDRQIFVPPPDDVARAEMFRVKLRDVPTEDLDAQALGARSAHFSGADIDGVIERAKETVLGDILDSGEERHLRQEDLLAALTEETPSTLEWLKTARNLVKFGGAGQGYKDVEKYLRAARLY